ncbi:MAG: metallophosphatase family protein [Planctomycetales bacterium]|nr:metallophosphatase family protein [Planctomycetales bacterium]
MRYGILGDIHSNFEALDTVIRELRKERVDRWISVGDVVGYGADPARCVDVVRELKCTVVAGNHDYAVCDRLNVDFFNAYAREAVLWTRKVLSREQMQFLEDLELISVLDGEVTVVHGSLNFPEMFDYIQTSYDAHLSLQALTTPVCFLGHSHVPVTFLQGQTVSYTLDPVIRLRDGERALVNVGSVGQPRDEDPRAAYAVYDSKTRTVEVKRIEYDVEAAGRKILDAGLPEILAERIKYGR